MAGKNAPDFRLPRDVRQRVSWRLSIWYAAYFIVTGSLLFLAVYFFLAHELTQRDRREVQQRYNVVNAMYVNGGVPRMQHQLPALAKAQRDAFFVLLSTQEGKLWFARTSQNDPMEEDTVKGLIEQRYNQTGEHPHRQWDELPSKIPGRSWSILTTHHDDVTLQVGMLTPNLEEMLSNFRTVFVLALLGVVALGVLGGMMLTNRTLRPIRWLGETVRSILATRTLEARVPVANTNDELAELSRLFNQMLDQQQYLIRSMHEALDNVAHDLRTPLTRLRGSAEVALQEEEKDADALRESLQDCLEESERVTSMLTTLMDISEAETGSMQLHLKKLDFAELVRGLADVYSLAAEDKNITFQLELPKQLMITADGPRLQQVVGNLLDNAIKYSAEGGKVAVRLQEVNETALLSVQDHGEGIAAEDLDRIWERLYRADKSRSHRGLGLGLSFVRAIVEAHDGQAKVLSQLGQGSTFQVSLPLQSC